MSIRTILLFITFLVGTSFTTSSAHAVTLHLQEEDIEAIRANAEELAARAQEGTEPLPEEEVKILSAVVMKVEGRSQWRQKEEDAWKTAKVDHMLKPGAQIRTGRKSKMTLRVGQNASVLVDRNSRVTLPQIVQAGATLKTAVELQRGRADFKVDHVGLTNDFSVVTPSTTLAVRGTGFGVLYGGLAGTETVASRLNEIFAIEVRYFLSRISYYISGGGKSDEGQPNPVINQLFQTFGPPPAVSALVEADGTPDQLADQLSKSPIVEQQAVDLAMQDFGATQEFVMSDPAFMPIPPSFFIDFGGFPLSMVADAICDHLTSIFTSYAAQLQGFGLGTVGLQDLESDIQAICAAAGGTLDDAEFTQVINSIFAYCAEQHPDPEDEALCIGGFGHAIVDFIFQMYGPPPGASQ